MMSHPSDGRGGIYEDFPGYRLPSGADIASAVRSALVAIDTNVLLDLYRYNESTRNDLLTVLRHLGDRLYVPHQVLREFWRLRLGVITNRGQTTREVLTALSKNGRNSKDAIAQWAKSIAIEESSRDQILRRVSTLYEEISESILHRAPGADNGATLGDPEPVLNELEKLLRQKVGRKLPDSEWQAAVKEGNRRVQNRIPPGYRDADKTSSDLPEGAAGDYLVWMQATAEAANRDLDLLIVTGDEKDDWWFKYRSDILGPNVELVAEFKAHCHRQLYMITPSDLLKGASILEVAVRTESVDDVERVRRERQTSGAYGRDSLTWEQYVEAGLLFLEDCARKRRLTTYSELNEVLTDLTGLPPFDFKDTRDRAAINHLLGLIVNQSFPYINAMISALVVYPGSNEPGPGFYQLAKDLGLLSLRAYTQHKLEFWLNQVKEVYEYFTRPSSDEYGKSPG